MNNLHVGILGAGGIAAACHVPVLSQMPGVEIAWLCDQVRARAQKLAAGWGIERVDDDLSSCPDVDVVLMAIPVGSRRDALALAFKRGWNVFVEKPFATSVGEHMRIVKEAKRAGVEVGVGLTRRFFRSTNVARLALAGGAFGPVREIWVAEASRMGTTGHESSWYQVNAAVAGGGVLMETGSHVVDQVFHMLGVEAFEGLRVKLTGGDGIDMEARAVTYVKCAGAAQAVPLHLVLSRMQDLYTGIVIRCERATLRIGVAAEGTVEVLGPDDHPLYRLDGAAGATNPYQAFCQEWQAFLEQCRSRKPSLADAMSSLLSTRFIESAYAIGAGERAS